MPVPGLAPDPGQRVLHCHVNWVKTHLHNSTYIFITYTYVLLSRTYVLSFVFCHVGKCRLWVFVLYSMKPQNTVCVCVLEILHEVPPFFLVSRETALFRQTILRVLTKKRGCTPFTLCSHQTCGGIQNPGFWIEPHACGWMVKTHVWLYTLKINWKQKVKS